MSLKPRILVADDDQALCRTLSWILKDNGSEVVTLPGGENLIEHLLADQFDLLILDIMMPKVDGLQLLEQPNRILHIRPHRNLDPHDAGTSALRQRGAGSEHHNRDRRAPAPPLEVQLLHDMFPFHR